MGSISLYHNDKNCCGCAACKDICPRQAITMTCDKNGFSIPEINEQLCVECKKCLSVCQYLKPVSVSKPIEVYAAVCKSNEALSNSASGGCFFAIADSVVKNGGKAVGSAYDKTEGGKLTVHHVIAGNTSELTRLQGSKYVQSDTEGIYRQMKELADQNIPLIFSGTPCQVAACKLSLGEKYDNVFYIDIICHGVPSLSLFHEYVTWLEKKQSLEVEKVVFRDKSKGWGLNGSILFHKNKKTYSKTFKTGGSSYYALFLQSQTYRDSCYECKFAGEYRCSDVTLGDFWGIKKVHPEYIKENGGSIDENKGISCLLINTQKGKELIRKFGNDLYLLPSEFKKAALENAQLNYPSKMGKNREEILKIFNNQGYEALDKWYFRRMGKKKYLYKLFDLLPAKRVKGRAFD